MKRFMYFLLISAAAVIIGCSSSNPDDQLAKIDKLMNKGFPIAPEQMDGINTHIAEGKRLLQEGKTEEASAALSKAIAILGQAEDADVFNKAD